AVLFTKQFYQNVRRVLRPGGIVITQNGTPFLQKTEFIEGLGALASVFPVTQCYLIAVPTYFGGHLALGWASENDEALNTPEHELAERAGGLTTRYYTPAHHRAAFVLPRFVEEFLAEAQASR